MKVPFTLAVLVVGLLSAQAQTGPMPKLPPDPATRTRYVSVFATMGALELMSAGFLVQVSEKQALGLVASDFILSGPAFILPPGAWGIGPRWAYYFSRDGKNKFLWANAITVDCQYLLPVRERKISWGNVGGVGLEAVVGRDGIVGPGLGIIWGAGISMSFHKDTPPLITPAIRLGFHLDV